MKEENFLLINPKSSMETFDINTLCQTKTNLFIRLGDKENHITLKNQINRVIAALIDIEYSVIENEDQLDILFRIINKYYKKAGIDINNQGYCNAICKHIACIEFNTEVLLGSELIENIGKVLAFGFVNLESQRKRLDYIGFMELIKECREDNICVLSDYLSNSNSNNESDNPLNHFSNGNGHVNGVNSHLYPISNELILLLNIFSSIKTIVLSLNDCSEVVLLSYLLLIMNYEWLFTQVLTISFDISCPLIQKELLNSYKADLNSFHHRKLHSNHNNKKQHHSISIWNKSKSDQHSNNNNDWVQISNISTKYKKFFLMIPLISHKILFIPHLQNFTLITPDSFKSEIGNSMKMIKGLTGTNTINSFLQLYLPFQYLLSLSIEFNCLELSSFEIILGIINNNIDLKHLSLSLFAKEEEYYYYSSLYKTATNESISLKPLQSSSSSSSSLNTKQQQQQHEEEEEEDPEFNQYSYNLSDYSLIENPQFITGFASNLEHLFLLLLTKKTLNSIYLALDIPGIINNNEQYYFAMIKFIFNIIILLNNNQAKNLTELRLIAPGIRFDNRKYPLFEQFFDRIDLSNKNTKLTSLTVQFQIISLSNVTNVLSHHLEYLFIGDLDLESLKEFVLYYQRDDFILKSQLRTIIVSLNSTLFDYDMFKYEVCAIIKGRYLKNLREIGLYCSCALRAFELKSLLIDNVNVNGNQIEKYTFQIKQYSPTEYWGFNYDEYYYYDYSYRLDYVKNRWLIYNVLSSVMGKVDKKVFELVMKMLNRGFVVLKVKKKKRIEILFK